MSILNDIQETELTLKEAKSVLTKLMLDYTPDQPITITIDTAGETKTFAVVPKRTRRKANGSAFTIQTIPYEELENISEVGTYISVDTLSLSSIDTHPCYYGLYINFENERDLRFFNDEEDCRNWLNKKIKLLEKQ